MDKLYTGDIPSDYHYAIFNNGYIDLYNTNVLHNNTYTRYRLYTNAGGFFYSVDNVSVGSFTTNYATDIEVTNEPVYRFDFPNVLFMTCVFTIFGVWLLNLLSSLIRKGGVLGGLL